MYVPMIGGVRPTESSRGRPRTAQQSSSNEGPYLADFRNFR